MNDGQGSSERWRVIRILMRAAALLRKLYAIAVRNALFRLRGMQLGRGSMFARGARVQWPHHLSFGMRNYVGEGFCCREFSPGYGRERLFVVGDDNFFDHEVTVSLNGNGARLQVGNNCWIGANCYLSPKQEIRIGDNCLIAAGCALYDFDHGIAMGSGWIKDQVCPAAAICIEDDAWLGHGVTVLKGVRVGVGAVVAAGSVVTKSIPDYEIWAGVPARKIGDRRQRCGGQESLTGAGID